MSKAVVPISGGLDSSVILSLAASVHDDIYAITFDYGQKHIKEMLYADKIMNTERYKELKDVGNKIAKKYLSTKYEQSVAKGIPMKYLNFFKEFSKKVKPLRIRYRGKSKPGYRRVSSFCHMAYAASFAIYRKMVH